MNCRIETMSALTVIGFEKNIANETAYRDCPAFWDQIIRSRMAPIAQKGGPVTELEQAICANCVGELGVCVCTGNNGFRYMIAGFYQGGPVPEGLTLYSFPEMEWAKFTGHGKMPDALQALNSQLYARWLPENKDYTLAISANIEWYSQGDMQSEDYEFGIWVPVRKKLGSTDAIGMVG